MPFLPVFGGGTSLFQPVYVGDIARLVDLISRGDENVEQAVAGKIIEAGGPQGAYITLCSTQSKLTAVIVFTYREIMALVCQFTGRTRPIISLPFAVGKIQGAILEKLPVNLFTVTRAQVCSFLYETLGRLQRRTTRLNNLKVTIL